MRRIGFYGSDDFGIIDLQPSDFELLISSGKVKISTESSFKSISKNKVQDNTQTPSNSTAIGEDFKLFDPVKHSSIDLPNTPGNYIVCLKEGSMLPDIGIRFEMKKIKYHSVIYTGIAGKSLTNRDYKQHFTGNNAGSSTLRKSLGSLFGFAKIARDKDPSNGKTKFGIDDEKLLSEWMKSNLVLFFKINSSPELLEVDLIEYLNPPLNLSKNKNINNSEYRKRLSELRSEK